MADILVPLLHRDGRCHPNSLGALSQAVTRAAELGGHADAAVLGELPDAALADLGAIGARRIFRASGTAGLAGPLVDLLDLVLDRHAHSFVLIGGGPLGAEVGGALAARRELGIVTEAIALVVQDGALAAERPILEDREIAVARFPAGAGVVIARANAFDVHRHGTGRPEIVDLAVPARSGGAQLSRRGEARGSEVDLEGAEVVVSAGRGFGSAEALGLADELAAAFGPQARVGATRAVVDAGWAPYSAQVGQTGRTVRPRLYLAAGVSGAIQHKVGMQGAEHIVAINRDPDAPIFAIADLGVVGDLHAILPRLSAAIAARRAGGGGGGD